jgi:hypothetical protein
MYRWIISLDVTMGLANRHICFLLDNFSGHYINYKPKNIDLEYFAPNLTSYVQPNDAGIIRTMKALYRKGFCLWAIELDDAGERDIYKINLLEGIMLVAEAWSNVQAATIVNCWNHTKIQPKTETNTRSPMNNTTETSQSSPMTNTRAWMVVRAFATCNEISLPAAEHQLHDILGARYLATDWDPVLKVIMDAENDTSKAFDGLDVFTNKIFGCRLTYLTLAHTPRRQEATVAPQQLSEAEQDLSAAVNDLKQRNRIVGTPLTLDEMLNPVEEEEVGHSDYRFEGGDEAIIGQVTYEEAVQRGDVIEVESDSDDSEAEEPEMSLRELIGVAAKLEKACIAHSMLEKAADLSRRLRQFQIELRRVEGATLRQSSLHKWFGGAAVV